MQRVSAISIEVVNNLALPCYSYLRQLMTFCIPWPVVKTSDSLVFCATFLPPPPSLLLSLSQGALREDTAPAAAVASQGWSERSNVVASGLLLGETAGYADSRGCEEIPHREGGANKVSSYW